MTLRLINGYDWFPTGQIESVRETLWGGAGLYWPGTFGGIIADVEVGRFGFGQAFSYQVGNFGPLNPFFVEVTGVTVTEGYMGQGVKSDGRTTSYPIMGFFDAINNAPQVSISFEANGVVRAWLGAPVTGTLLGNSEAGCFVDDQWFYAELHGIIDPSAGDIEVKINTISVLHLINVNTQNTARAATDSVLYGGTDAGLNGQYYWAFDDLYFLDTAGSVNNSWLGNVRVPTQFASGAGASTQFTPVGAGTNWQAALNTLENDSIYDGAATAGFIDLYTVQAVVSGPMAFGLQIRSALRQDDATQLIARNVLKSGSTQVEGVDHATNQTFTHYKDIWELDPHTGVGWTGTGVNAIEIGPKLETIL